MRQFIATFILVFASLITVQAQSVGHGADIDAQINSRQAQKTPKKPQAEPRKPAEPAPSEVSPSGERMKMVLRKIKVRKKTPEELAETRTKVTKGVHHEQGFRIQVFRVETHEWHASRQNEPDSRSRRRCRANPSTSTSTVHDGDAGWETSRPITLHWVL